MSEELIDFDLPVERSSIIKVLGIGGGGNNAVNHMYNEGITDVNFVICNTDAQALAGSRIPVKVQIGEDLTEGRGAGSKPEIGRRAAEENIDQVLEALGGNTRMVFITTGMGGGTGTGAAPVIARACKEAGLLTIAVVTIPFKSEGKIRIKNAVQGINELKDHVDSLLVINNEKLREIFGDQPVSTAFAKADDVLTMAVKGIAEIITVAGYINVDFADVETVMHDSGAAVMGTGSSAGEDRALKAIEEAISSPLLNSNDIHGARSILLNITTGMGEHELTMDELGEITDYVYDVASSDALIIRGLSKDENLGDKICVTVIATGFEPNSVLEPYRTNTKTEKINLETGQVSTAVPEKKKEEQDTIRVKTKKRELFDDFENDLQKKLEFDFVARDDEEQDGLTQGDGTLRKIKHMQNILKNEGLSNQTMRENVDEFEDVPAFIRKKIKIDNDKRKDNSEVSKFTLSDDDDEPSLRDDNAYLNDNVD
ncbi:MAG: cell division protein FtsZ [Bacteroidales bacterium]|jgi:cell division protein FtsZ|nr:cell division protein FtsZ [Bacteroidales bacterium]